jgi:hypothetical protein
VAYKWFIAEHLPNVPYMTVLDTYIYGCLIMIVAVIAESMIIIYVHCDLESHGGGALLVFGDRL